MVGDIGEDWDWIILVMVIGIIVCFFGIECVLFIVVLGGMFLRVMLFWRVYRVNFFGFIMWKGDVGFVCGDIGICLLG